jgi:hypothetical protein
MRKKKKMQEKKILRILNPSCPFLSHVFFLFKNITVENAKKLAYSSLLYTASLPAQHNAREEITSLQANR